MLVFNGMFSQLVALFHSHLASRLWLANDLFLGARFHSLRGSYCMPTLHYFFFYVFFFSPLVFSSRIQSRFASIDSAGKMLSIDMLYIFFVSFIH